jgi:putative flippase GtrA
MIAVAIVLTVVLGPLLLGVTGVLRAWRTSEPITGAAIPWSLRQTIGSALLYTLAFNLTFFIQEFFLVLPKAFLPGVRPTLFHNNHDWEGENPLTSLFQGTGALAIFVGGIAFALLVHRCLEVPCRFDARRRGASKLDTLTALQFGVLILDKLIGRTVPVSLVLFLCVGATGLIVHLAALYALLALGAPFPLAQSGAVWVAMTSNFLLNNLITYSDLRLRGRQFLRGLLSFYLVCSIGAVANVSLASLIYREWRLWWRSPGPREPPSVPRGTTRARASSRGGNRSEAHRI